MGRITKALDKLRTKCTEAGTHPSGNSAADILECIAEHYEGGGGGGMVIIESSPIDPEKVNPDTKKAELTLSANYNDIIEAYEAGKEVAIRLPQGGGVYSIFRIDIFYNGAGNGFARFEQKGTPTYGTLEHSWEYPLEGDLQEGVSELTELQLIMPSR